MKRADAILMGDVIIRKRRIVYITKKPEVKRGRGGAESIYHRVWNENNPNDMIIPNTGYVIHHIDFIPENNDILNLQKMTDTEHKKLHMLNGNHPNKGKKFTKEMCENLSKAHIGQVAWNKGLHDIYSEETKIKMFYGRKGKPPPCSMLGKKHSEETKKKMSNKIPWNKGTKNIISEETRQKMINSHLGKSNGTNK